ncbi:hypothetical protein KI387_007357 [Taxus chinensis]|uniref:4-hydroxyphenylpyruvate dioxygenase n=1 Tax=Taxus chinensis TaxID=29808 RepID=A0AA38GR66_TAXCH|nr:hypothetical protein KI387_007357 [Taxus chinensis]
MKQQTNYQTVLINMKNKRCSFSRCGYDPSTWIYTQITVSNHLTQMDWIPEINKTPSHPIKNTTQDPQFPYKSRVSRKLEQRNLSADMGKEDERFKLVGYKNFVRHNPMTDHFPVKKFHHIEFWCGDATNTYRRFSWGLGMQLVAKSDQTTGNQTYCSFALQSNDLQFVFTAPYSSNIDQTNTKTPHPAFDSEEARRFFSKHGLAVRAVGILVNDAEQAFEKSVKKRRDRRAETPGSGRRCHRRKGVKTGYDGPFLPNYEAVKSVPLSYGIVRLDHAVGNVEVLEDAIAYVAKFTGFHRFAEFTAEDVGDWGERAEFHGFGE